MRKLFRAAIVVGVLVLVALALLDQLVRDPRYRDWHGDVFGVPYDLRFPTRERLRERAWAPDNPAILTPHVFGVGWSINLGRIVWLIRARS